MYKQKELSSYLPILLLIGVVIIAIKSIFTDFGVDSAFQISMGYRLATGDTMFKEMWEPYQTSAFLCAFFIKIYLDLFHTTTGIVIYLQLMGVIIDFVVSFFLFKVIKRLTSSQTIAMSMSFVVLCFSPKDVPIADYTNMMIWFSLLLFIFFSLYLEKQRIHWLVLSAVSLCLCVLSYPSCFILFFTITILLFLYKKKGFFSLLILCLSCGALYLISIFHFIKPQELLLSIKYMLAIESSHSTAFSVKIFEYFKSFLLLAAIITAIILIGFLCAFIVHKFTKKPTQLKILALTCTFSLLISGILCVVLILFPGDRNRYSYSFIYPVIILVGTCYAKRPPESLQRLYFCGTAIGVTNFLATLILTNLTFISSVPMLQIAVISAFIPISEMIKEIVQATTCVNPPLKCGKLLCRILVTFAIIITLLRGLYVIRPMTLFTGSVTDIGGIVKSGPAIGIISDYMGPYVQNESIKEWQEFIPSESNIYVVGYSLDTLGYLYLDTRISAPSLVPTPGYNSTILEYWKMNPDKYPDVIIASCWFGNMNFPNDEGQWLLEWIEQDFKPDTVIDGQYWRYYIRDKSDS